MTGTPPTPDERDANLMARVRDGLRTPCEAGVCALEIAVPGHPMWQLAIEALVQEGFSLSYLRGVMTGWDTAMYHPFYADLRAADTVNRLVLNYDADEAELWDGVWVGRWAAAEARAEGSDGVLGGDSP